MGAKCSGLGQVAWWLLVIGGVNWGLVGFNGLLELGGNWNVVNLVLGNWMWLENLVYLLVGVSALYLAFSCCKEK